VNKVLWFDDADDDNNIKLEFHPMKTTFHIVGRIQMRVGVEEDNAIGILQVGRRRQLQRKATAAAGVVVVDVL
jgi:hypothetical protein